MFKLLTFFSFLTAILLFIGYIIGGFYGMVFALVFSIILNLVTYWFSSDIILKAYKAEKNKDKTIDKIVENMAREAKIPKPKVYIIKNDIPNAFATGRNPNNAVVALTEGLLVLNKEEIEGVIAHEISHIKNRDVLVSTIAAVIAGGISFIAQIGYWSLLLDDNNEGSTLGMILIILFAPLAAFLVRMAISRSMEYKADYSAVQMTKKPKALASALRKISDVARSKPMRGLSATSHMFIINPFKRDFFNNLFSTHPPIARRVKRLEDMYHEGIPTPPVIEV